MPRFFHRHGTILLYILLLLSSCAQDEVLYGGDADGSLPALGLSAVQATDMDVSKTVTRAVATPDYPTSGYIGFFVKADATNGYKAVDNRKGEYNTARKLWLPQAATPADSIWLNNHDADIAVYAPYNAAHTTAATLNLTASLRPADGSKDIWCKRFAANNKGKSLAVTLEHLYTRLTVVVSRDADYKSDANLTTFVLKGNEIYPSATYKPFETVPYTNSTTTGFTPAVMAQTLDASTASATYDLLLIPATLTDDITLTLTVDGKKMQVKIAKERFAAGKLEAGKQYNVNLKLKPGKLEITSVSVVKWDVLTEVSGGQAEFEPFLGIQLPPEDITLGGTECTDADKQSLSKLIWAEGNLKSTGTGGVTKDYVWTDTQSESGYYYTWNSSYTGNTSSNGVDPCSLLDPDKYGYDWRTPSKSEFDMLSRCTDKQWVAYKGVNGMWFMNKPKGVFLPAAGFRNSLGSGTTPQRNDGLNGYYWSKEDDDNCSALYFSSGFAHTATAADAVFKTDGNSVRCVKVAK